MNFFKTVKLQDAIHILKKESETFFREERISLVESLGRMVSEDIFSPINLPEYNRSTVDGYGVKIRDCQLASETFPTLLSVVGEVLMGEIDSREIKSGEAVYIPTGGAVPNGCDGVVMVEYCDSLGEEILVNRGIGKYENMVRRGEEIQLDEKIMEKGSWITPAHIALLAGIGKQEVNVYEKIRCSIISTGDEIISLEEILTPGKIFDINSYSIEAHLKKNPVKIVSNTLVKDEMEQLRETLLESIGESDIIFISGGSSVGTRDFTLKTIEELEGEILVHGIDIKPGKPTIIAKCKNRLIIGLPGHPQSALNVLRIVTDSLFPKKNRILYGRLLENISGEPGKTVFVNVNIVEGENEILVNPLLSKSSMIKPLVQCDGYIVVDSDQEGVYRDTIVKVVLNG